MTPIQSIKNQRSTVTTAVPNTNIQDFVGLATEVGSQTKIIGNEITVGASVYSMDISVNFVSIDNNETGVFEWVFMKLRQGQSVIDLITTPNWTDIGLSNGRNQVIKSYQAIYATNDAGAIRYNVHIKIPKIYQRMRAGDSFVIVSRSDGAGTLLTGARYKFYQ